MNLEQFCAEFKKVVMGTKANTEVINEGQLLLQQFVQDADFLKELFTRAITDEHFSSQRVPTLDDNEVFLYKDPDRLFTIKLFVWKPEHNYPIHDHGSWGIVGCLAGELAESKFKRIDQGEQPYFAEIVEVQKALLKPGETTHVHPLNNGIHKISAVSRLPAISIHVYGKPIRKGYIQLFDQQQKSVQRLYAPNSREKISVINALAALNTKWSTELLERAMASKQDYEVEEARAALGKIE